MRCSWGLTICALALAAPRAQMESACVEGNRDLENYIDAEGGKSKRPSK